MIETSEMRRALEDLQRCVAADRAELSRLRAALADTDAQNQNLTIALGSARMIGMAIGVLIERDKVTPEGAFDLLRQRSQQTHVKLRTIAENLVYTGEYPPAAPARAAHGPASGRARPARAVDEPAQRAASDPVPVPTA